MIPAMLAIFVLSSPAAAVWWDDYPTTIQTSHPDPALQSNATSCLCGIADDPVWGIHGMRCRYFSVSPRLQSLLESDLKILSWTEAYGAAQQHIADFERLPDGDLAGYDADPATPRPKYIHWSWHIWQPQDNLERHWIGPQAYYQDEQWVRPWTRTHPEYGAPPITYPDGTIARGYISNWKDDFDLHRIYDAAGAKDVLGRLSVHYGDNPQVNEIDPETGQVRGPINGLIPHQTPDGLRYSGHLVVRKDFCCPHWVEYARASARQMIDFGVEGIWADNFSGWDCLGSRPVTNAFGEWSIALFAEYLQHRLPADRLQALGIGKPAEFDVTAYLRAKMTNIFGGDPADFRDPNWRDERWLDDAIWRHYLIFKTQAGRRALKQFHDAFHTAARQAGVEDFCIQGNDIPIWCFDMPRPDSLEMVSTEFSPSWNLLTGPRGIGLPPHGRISPIVKMARAHQKSRFVHFWYYLTPPYDRYAENAGLGRVIAYELLAHHAMIQAYPSQEKVAGTPESHREVFGFINDCRDNWGDRRPIARIALLYSPNSRLSMLAPGGFVHRFQPHIYDLLGWGTAFSQLHTPYRVIPEWQLNRETLDAFSALIMPSVNVLDPKAVTQAIAPWLKEGGTLIISGPAGTRYDREGGFSRVANPAGMLPELCQLLGIDQRGERPEEFVQSIGNGTAILLPALGFDYYQTDPRQRRLDDIRTAARTHLHDDWLIADDESLPQGIEVSLFASPSRPVLFADLANLDFDPDTDERPRPHEVTLRISVPGRITADLQAHVLRPLQPKTSAQVSASAEDGITIGPITVDNYASVTITGYRCTIDDMLR